MNAFPDGLCAPWAQLANVSMGKSGRGRDWQLMTPTAKSERKHVLTAMVTILL